MVGVGKIDGAVGGDHGRRGVQIAAAGVEVPAQRGVLADGGEMIAALADKKLAIRAGRDAGGSHEITRRRKTAVTRSGCAGEWRILPERFAMGVDGKQTTTRAK